MTAAPPSTARTLALSALTMIAFASNSILCRLALAGHTIDPASFTTLRLASGALTLYLISRFSGRGARRGGGWRSAFFLVLYAAAFSFAYITLSAGTGALLLFGAVQATMMIAALRFGERPGAVQWTGFGAALGGLVFLTAPGLTAPSPAGSALMVVAGFAWGMYTLRGRRDQDPLAATARNFARALPFAVAVSLATITRRDISVHGAGLAVASGAIASGIGYVVWYAALKGLSATRAATVQLSVPVIAALGGVLFLSERVTPRLAIAAVFILGGVGLALTGRTRRSA